MEIKEVQDVKEKGPAKTPAFLFLNCILFGNRVKTEDAEKTCDAANFGEGLIELGG